MARSLPADFAIGIRWRKPGGGGTSMIIVTKRLRKCRWDWYCIAPTPPRLRVRRDSSAVLFNSA